MAIEYCNLIQYHTIRSAEENDRAGMAADGPAAFAHLELSRLHAAQAHWLRDSNGGLLVAQQVD